MTRCRLCGSGPLVGIVDLGATPPCERFLTAGGLDEPEPTYPLHLRVCEQCWLVQLPVLIQPEEIFSEYAYFSSFSTTMVEHARQFVVGTTQRLGLDAESFVVEVASNDGYLLQHVRSAGIRCLGVEPARNVAAAAVAAGVPTVSEFLDVPIARRLREEHGPADLVVANNVWAHVPDILGFTAALGELAAPEGWISIEVQYLRTMLAHAQFDTIYHEHMQYWSVGAARRALAAGGLRLVDVEFIDTHGGSIRLWARRADCPDAVVHDRVQVALDEEKNAGLEDLACYSTLAGQVARIRRDLLVFLIEASDAGKLVVGYGAPGKANTLLNYCGVRPDLLAYTVDRNPYKHGRFTPGSRIPILAPEAIAVDRPDHVLVLAWNLREEISRQLSYVADWGGSLVVPLPRLETWVPTP